MTFSAAAFLDRYDALRDSLPGAAEARARAAASLRVLGLPGPRDEAWKYTSLRALTETPFHSALTEAGDPPAKPAMPDLGELAEAPRLVFAAGRYRADLSRPPAFAFTPFSAAPGFTADEAGAIRTLNTLLAEDGATLHVPENQDGGTLLLISLGSDAHGTPAAFHPRHHITLAKGARLTVIDISTGQGVYLHNPVTDIDLAEGAVLSHLRLQTESAAAFHLASVHTCIAAGASYDGFTLTLGGKLARAEIHATLAGPGAHAALNAAQILGDHQHGDFTTVVAHAAPHGASRQTVKNVLDGHARAVFQGKIEVARAAQKTDGYQMNQALLLSPHAEIDSKPQLEIYADDVKCSHGATVGELDADQLFYLLSRGIPAGEAKSMLVRAFLTEALDVIAEPAARALFEAALNRVLPA